LLTLWLRRLGWGVLALWLAFVVLASVLRFVVLPQVGAHQAEIEAMASHALGLSVRFGKIEAAWRGLSPVLAIETVRVADAENRPVLTLGEATGVLSWKTLWSVFSGRPIFAALVLERLALEVRRDAEGHLHVAGLPLSDSPNADGQGLAWLLAQSRLSILHATVLWRDEFTRAPDLVLEDVSFTLDNFLSRHRFGLTAAPSPAFVSKLDLRGDLHGDAEGFPGRWTGRLYADLQNADLPRLRPWLAGLLPRLQLASGNGQLKLWLAVNGKDDWRLSTQSDLQGLSAAFDDKRFAVDAFAGRLALGHADGFWQVATGDLMFAVHGQPPVSGLSFDAGWKPGQGEHAFPGQGRLSANSLDLARLTRLALRLPLPEEVAKSLRAAQPAGLLTHLSADWQADAQGTLTHYRLKSAFDRLGVAPLQNFAGVEGISGKVALSETGGELALDSKEARLRLPGLFSGDGLIALTRLLARLKWKVSGDNWNLDVAQLDFAGPDAAGSASGTYESAPDGPGRVNFSAKIARAKATAIWRYLPRHGIDEEVIDWLKKGLVSGNGYNGELLLQGDLKDFPFEQPGSGVFQITAQARDARLHVGEGWPDIEGIDADMRFGAGMEIRASRARILGVPISAAVARIPQFAADDPHLLIDGQAAGDTGAFLRYIGQSPVAEMIHHFTDTMSAKGNGRLALKLDLPILEPEKVKVDGRFTLADNSLRFLPWLPEAQKLSGVVAFTEKSLGTENAAGVFLDAPFKLSARSDGGAVEIEAAGGAKADAAARQLPQWPLLNKLRGQTNWQAKVSVDKQIAHFRIDSDLQGLAADLPSPLTKRAADALPLRVESSPLPGGERFDLTIGQLVAGRFETTGGATRGVFALGASLGALPASGIAGVVRLPVLDLDAWQALLPAASATGSGGGFPLTQLTLDTDTLTAHGQTLHAVSLRLSPGRANSLHATFASTEAEGEVDWQAPKLTANLKRLHLAESPAAEAPAAPPARSTATASQTASPLAAIDLKINDLVWGQKALGRLQLSANRRGSDWLLTALTLENKEGKLNGSGYWWGAQTGKKPAPAQSRLDFKLTATNAGALLTRLGAPDMVRRGTANLDGHLRWPGSPADFDDAKLSGELRLKAAKGQFLKVEPGVGKLLGLLSLQSIARRISLDFRDVLGSGFAFDDIHGRFILSDGIISTSDKLSIVGPAGEAIIEGTADMKSETQNLKVDVRPEVSGVAAVGAAVAINPIVGAGVLLAQNLLKNPLNRALTLHYQVTGSWNDPQVERLPDALFGGEAAKSKPETETPQPGGVLGQ
jgi:uncharacterized protein (TIGR02099 family)